MQFCFFVQLIWKVKLHDSKSRIPITNPDATLIEQDVLSKTTCAS